MSFIIRKDDARKTRELRMKGKHGTAEAVTVARLGKLSSVCDCRRETKQCSVCVLEQSDVIPHYDGRLAQTMK